MTRLDQLPFELVSLIIEHHIQWQDYYELALTNKRLYTAVIPIMYRHLSVDSNQHRFSLFNTAILQHSPSPSLPSPPLGQHVRILSSSYDWTDTMFLAWMKHLPNLNELCVDNGRHLTDTSLQHLGAYCPHLTKLELRNCPITHIAIANLGRHCHHLTKLTLEACQHLGCDLFTALQACPLEHIYIKYCHLMDNTTTSSGLDALVAQHRLKYLRIWESTALPFNHCQTYDPKTVWPQLTELTLDVCHSLNEQQVIALIQSHPRLTGLTLDGGGLTDATLLAIATYLPTSIDSVGLCGNRAITVAGLYHVIRQCPLLSLIDVHDCGIYGKHFPYVEYHGLYGKDVYERMQLHVIRREMMEMIRTPAN